MPRPWLLPAVLLLSILTAKAEAPPLLAEAFRTFQADQNRWAYVETASHPNKAGQIVRDQVTRIDPSATYADQLVPEVINGHPATPSQLAEWARRNDETARLRQAAAQRLGGLEPPPDFQLKIYQFRVRPQFDRATVLTEDASSVTFEIPLELADGRPFPDYQLTAQVDKQRRDFLHATCRQTKLIQIKGGKWTGGLIEVTFTRPDPNQATVPSRTVARVTNKPLFGAANFWHNQTERTDFRRVTPYDERFKVKIGPLRVLGF